jgi:2-succinyl-6-hydroxy-2,4-cyclohexadiene-1-carboxylate synthase
MIRHFESRFGPVEFSDEGPDSSIDKPVRDPVVLFHGFTGAKDSWLGLRRELRRRYRVIAVDLPGHGGTDFGSEITNYSLEATAAMVKSALVEGAKLNRFALVGYSMGGRLALFFALQYAALVSKLVLESASPGIAEPKERQQRRESDCELAGFIEAAGVEAFVDRWESVALFESLSKLPANERARLRSQRMKCSAQGLARSLRGMGVGAQSWLGDRLQELTMPVLVVAGELDRKYAEIARAMAARIADGRIEVVGGTGHVVHVENSSAFNRLVADFLEVRAHTDQIRGRVSNAD